MKNKIARNFLLSFSFLSVLCRPIFACVSTDTIFDCLKLSLDSTPAAIRKAYRAEILKIHPDKLAQAGRQATKEELERSTILIGLFEEYNKDPESILNQASAKAAAEFVSKCTSEARRGETSPASCAPGRSGRTPPTRTTTFIKVQDRTLMGHAVYHIEGDDPNTVWTVPLRVIKKPGFLGVLTGKKPELLPKYRLSDDEDEGKQCVKLNPRNQRKKIRDAMENGERPTRGCYLPSRHDFEQFSAANRVTKSSGSYQMPENLGFDKMFCTSTRPDPKQKKAFYFDGKTGNSPILPRSTTCRILCRCVGEPW